MLKRDDDYYRWPLPPVHLTDNLIYARECAPGDAGITLLPRFLSDEPIAAGELTPVLPSWQVESSELWRVYPSRKLNSPALARFVESALRSDIFRLWYQ